MEAEEDDSRKHNQPSPLLVDDTHPELQSDEQHCISKSIVEEKESPSHDVTVESSPLRDSLITGTCSIVEERGIVEEKVFPDIVEDMTEGSVKLMMESDMAEMTVSGFGELTEDVEEAGEKAVDDFVEDKVVYELGLVDGNEKLVHGGVLVASFPENAVEEGSAKREGEMLAETSIYMPDAEVSDVINSVEKTEVVENADDPDVVNEIGVPKKDTFATEDGDLGVPVSLVDESAMEEGEETDLADETGEVVKMENVISNSAEVGLTDSGGKIAEVGNVGKAEDNIVTDKTDEVVMENLEEENAEVQGIVLRDGGVEVLKIENVGDQDTEVQGMGVADEIADLRKIGSMVDATAEVKRIGVTDYTVEVENTEDLVDRTAHEEEIDLAEETAEADEMVYLVDETIGLEETDADETCMVEETEAAEEVEEMDVGVEADEASRGSSGSKRKRGKNSRAPARVPSRKTVEEDVCFICFDGGDLVLCDRRGCPKAYHPSCINRDDAFFRSGRWNCGWHLCSNCEKSAHYMCYTCTFSLCKGCIKNAVILCVRGNRGFCETCMKFVTLIEKTERGDMEKGQIDFNDKNSWEFLFKEYWTDLKERLSLTFDELVHAKNPWKRSDPQTRSDSPGELYDGNVDGGSGLEISENEESGSSKKRRPKKRSKSHPKEMSSPSMSISAGSQGLSTDDNVEWASKELLEFVMHMRNGDKAVLSQFDVQALLLEYIKRNKLRDPRRKSQIICDSRLENLFGKPRVGHFEMLKLLESHFLVKEDAQTNDLQGSIADTESSQLEADGHPDASAKTKKEKKRKTRKKSDERGLQSNLDDYAAIDIHNINLIYFRRSLMEYLIEDEESFHDKVVGSFVRIRISGSAQKQDLYRLVQIVGTSKASEPYKVGKRMSDILLEILNLNKTEVISIDIISNQEFTEDECKRLRQSMKCGILNRLTVGDIQEKAMSLQDVRVKDWMETEIVRLSHLRDRASEKGRRKELRECVEKLQLLKTPEERQRRLEEIPEIHTDPKMDPSHESEDEDEADDRRQETYALPRSTSFGRRTREPVSPGKGGSNLNDSWTGMRNFPSMNRDLSSNSSSKAFSNHVDDAIGSGEIINENSWSQGRDRDVQKLNKLSPTSEIIARNALSGVPSDLSSAAHSPNPAAPPPLIGTAQHASEVNESEKIWRYQDPSGKIQGPFSIVQLRKWSNTGYFPAELRIWRASDKQEDSLLLTDVLAGKMHKNTPLVDKNFQKSEVTPQTHHTSFVGKPHGTTVQLGIDVQDTGISNSHTNPISSGQSSGGRWKPQIEVSSTGRPTSASIGAPKYSGDRWSSDYGNNNNFTSLPSPTPSSGGAKERQSQAAATFLDPRTLPGGNGGLQTSSFTPDRSMQASENDSFRSQSSLNPTAKTEKGMSLGPINALQVHPQPIVASNQQQHIQPSTSPNVPWGMGAPENQSTVPRPGFENQNQGWGPMPAGNLNMGWGATAHANANNMWGAAAQGSAPGSTNPGWIAPGQGPASGNPVQGWAPHSPMPPQVNPNPGWVAPSQGPPPPAAPGNVNTSWPNQSGNQNMWGNEHGKNGDRFSNHRDGGDYGSGGKSWVMQSSFGGRGGGGSGGGGFSRPPYNYGQRVCIFHENGHCRKGASCDYIHN